MTGPPSSERLQCPGSLSASWGEQTLPPLRMRAAGTHLVKRLLVTVQRRVQLPVKPTVDFGTTRRPGRMTKYSERREKNVD